MEYKYTIMELDAGLEWNREIVIHAESEDRADELALEYLESHYQGAEIVKHE